MTGEKFIEILDCLKGIIVGTKWEGHVYAVGGSVRDYCFAGRDIKDIDLVIDLPNGGIEFANWLYDNHYLAGHVVSYEHYGTAMFCLKDFPDEELEAVQTRKECYRNMESRNPETAYGTIQDDCQRRDFTYNALYMDVMTKEIKDFNGHGLEDLQNDILRTCGDPDVIFTEDPLRILRAVRFTCRYGSSIEKKTSMAMEKYAPRLDIISRERIQDELNKILESGQGDFGMRLLINMGIFDYIFPEINKEGMLELFSRTGNREPLTVYLAILFSTTKRNKIEEIMRGLKYEVAIIKEVMFLLDNYDVFKVPGIASVRRIQDLCKTPDIYDKLIRVNKILKKNACNTPENIMNEFYYYNLCLIEDGRSMYNYKLPVDGNFIMEFCRMEPCSGVKMLLDLLRKEAYENPTIDKEFCESFLRKNSHLWLF